MKTSRIYNPSLNVKKVIEILKIIHEVDDLELKDCALESLLEMLEEQKDTFENN